MNRPKTRGECLNGPRPCPWVSCRYHLAIDVKKAGYLEVKEGWETRETCALDVADSGAHSFRATQELLQLSAEGMKMAYRRALKRFARNLKSSRVDADNIGMEEWQDALARKDWRSMHAEKS